MTTFLRLAILLLPLIPLNVTWAAPPQEIRVFELHHITSGEALPPLRKLLGEKGSVTSVHNRVVVKTVPEELQRVAEFLKSIDIPRKSLLIEVRQSSNPSGVSIGAGARHSQVSMRLGNARQTTEQRIQILDGEEAFIMTGQEVPYSSQTALMGGKHPAYSRSVAYQTVATGFRLQPTLLKKGVRLEITPFQEEIAEKDSRGDQPPRILFHQAATSVLVPLNIWQELAQTKTTSGSDSISAFRWTTGRAHQKKSIQIRIAVQEMNP
ncbi:MAG: hypothetical protein JXB25_02155 [Deltaproteobacteria bacterium]|nr:hypothetical protein [Deltaproteobacteria bacterium]